MDKYRFVAQKLAGSAKTIAPVTDRKYGAPQSDTAGSDTTQPDSFFDIDGVVASADVSFSELIGVKRNKL